VQIGDVVRAPAEENPDDRGPKQSRLYAVNLADLK
jgi:hypothetical protein